MDMMQAITAHINVKKTLSSYVMRPDHSLNPSQVGATDQCTLGKWIIGEGRRYSSMQEYRALLISHRRFHQAAEEVVRRADSGQCVEQEIALDSTSEYAAASADVVRAIMFLYGRISATEELARHRDSAVPNPKRDPTMQSDGASRPRLACSSR